MRRSGKMTADIERFIIDAASREMTSVDIVAAIREQHGAKFSQSYISRYAARIGAPVLGRSERMARNRQNPAFEASRLAAETPELWKIRGAASSETLARLRQDREFREKQAAAARRTLELGRQDPDFVANQAKAAGETLRRIHKGPGFGQKTSNGRRVAKQKRNEPKPLENG